MPQSRAEVASGVDGVSGQAAQRQADRPDQSAEGQRLDVSARRRVPAVGQRPDAQQQHGRAQEFAEDVPPGIVEDWVRREHAGPAGRRADEFAPFHRPADQVLVLLEGPERLGVIGVDQQGTDEVARELGAPVGQHARPRESPRTARDRVTAGLMWPPLNRPQRYTAIATASPQAVVIIILSDVLFSKTSPATTPSPSRISSAVPRNSPVNAA